MVDLIEDLELMDEKWDKGVIGRWINHNVVQPSYERKLDDFLLKSLGH